jgi:hypothetical protein
VGAYNGRVRALLESIPIVLPPELEPYAEKWIENHSNGLTNSKSRPSTSDILVTSESRKSHYKYTHEINFCSTVVVQQHQAKRRAIATRDGSSMYVIAQNEIGLVLFLCDKIPGIIWSS